MKFKYCNIARGSCVECPLFRGYEPEYVSNYGGPCGIRQIVGKDNFIKYDADKHEKFVSYIGSIDISSSPESIKERVINHILNRRN